MRTPDRLRTAHRLPALAAVAVAGATLLAACGGGSGYSTTAPQKAPSAATGVVVRAHTDGQGHTLLVDGAGKTLYAADQESTGSIKCTSSCLSFWFPLTMKGAAAPQADGVPAGKLGTVRRSDNGQTQVTYNGKPLYTFSLDTSAGSAKGDGFSDHFGGTTFDWHAATLNGATTGVSGGSGSSGGTRGGYGSSGY